MNKVLAGGIITVGAAIAGLFGIAIDVETQAQLADYLVVVVTGIGGMMTIYYKIKEQK